MKASILAVTRETEPFEYNKLSEDILKSLEVYSGKCAGICYMKDEYFNTNVSDPDKAETRFNKVAPTGHHSIAEHCFITILFENIPKMTAIILNSLGFYNTSEKSGRYTEMISKDSVKHLENYKLYYKWKDIFETLIKEYDETIDDKLREKLAMENARYMLSVFAPSTTMAYTTSLRMWSYIRDMCDRYLESQKNKKLTGFDIEVLSCIEELCDCIASSNVQSQSIEDNKNRELNFLAKQVGYNIDEANVSYSDSYLIKYKVSFADIAQEERHRTIDYFMCFDGSKSLNFYVPKILRDTIYEKEWISDLNSVNDTFPIATQVDIVETGTITNFLYKCDERLCGRVQLETMENVMINLLKFGRDWNKSPFMIKQLEKHLRNGKVIMKCGNIKCKEPCHWGALRAKDRLI